MEHHRPAGSNRIERRTPRYRRRCGFPGAGDVAVHFSNLGHNLAQLGRALDRFPNLNVDLSARAYEFGRQPFTAPAFFAKYKDRILYGSDQEVTPEMWRSWWRILETRDEYIRGPAGWQLYGMGLPDNVLEAVYSGNAKRLLNWTNPPIDTRDWHPGTAAPAACMIAVATRS